MDRSNEQAPLTETQSALLRMVAARQAKGQPVSCGALAKALGKSTQVISRQLELIERAGWIEREQVEKGMVRPIRILGQL